jgi:diguanylate cyclase (GGDEF)-like protein
MAHGKSRLYDDAAVVLHSDISVAPVAAQGHSVHSVRDARREIDTLRSINAHLVQQIAALKQREAHALRLADRDGLTGLYNRRRMLELLGSAIADAARQGHRVGLLFIDLDGFKGVNDAHGHGVGDRLLCTVASRIGGRTRQGDFVCRYGGDEFVVILPHAADLAAVGQVARSIRKRVSLPYQIDGVELTVSAAIGTALFPDLALEAGDLLRIADESMYRAKLRPAESADPVDGLTAPRRRRDDRCRAP